ncbi:unnamed protein product [Closterium sp. NIES-53]
MKESDLVSQGPASRFPSLPFPQRTAQERKREEEWKKREEAYEKEMARFVVRTVPLGLDRHYNRYWLLSGEPKVVWVEERGGMVGEEQMWQGGSGGGGGEGGSVRGGVGGEVGTGWSGSRWFCYTYREDIEELIASLNEKGIREAALKAALEKVKGRLIAGMKKRGPGVGGREKGKGGGGGGGEGEGGKGDEEEKEEVEVEEEKDSEEDGEKRRGEEKKEVEEKGPGSDGVEVEREVGQKREEEGRWKGEASLIGEKLREQLEGLRTVLERLKAAPPPAAATAAAASVLVPVPTTAAAGAAAGVGAAAGTRSKAATATAATPAPSWGVWAALVCKATAVAPPKSDQIKLGGLHSSSGLAVLMGGKNRLDSRAPAAASDTATAEPPAAETGAEAGAGKIGGGKAKGGKEGGEKGGEERAGAEAGGVNPVKGVSSERVQLVRQVAALRRLLLCAEVAAFKLCGGALGEARGVGRGRGEEEEEGSGGEERVEGAGGSRRARGAGEAGKGGLGADAEGEEGEEAEEEEEEEDDAGTVSEAEEHEEEEGLKGPSASRCLWRSRRVRRVWRREVMGARTLATLTYLAASLRCVIRIAVGVTAMLRYVVWSHF